MKLKTKKTAVGILTVVLMLMMGTTAFAAKQVRNGNFVDTDNDGICDNYVPGQDKGNGSGRNGNFVDTDNDGICDNYVHGQCKGNGSGRNRNFVDTDNDGICDNYVSGQCHRNGCRGGRNR